MANDIFQVDWVLVDIIIIVLLFLLLIGVKIFKSTHRWRLKYSNEALEHFHLPKYSNFDRFNLVKYCSLTRNSFLHKEFKEYPSILIRSTKFKKHLTKFLIEGLSSYGFNVINFNLNDRYVYNTKILNQSIEKKIKTLFSGILDYFYCEGLITNSNYILLNLSKSFMFNLSFLSDSQNIGLICINPRIKKNCSEHSRGIYNILLEYPRLFIIFSNNSFFFFKNRDLKHYRQEFHEKISNKIELITLNKTDRNFKYYETILLGIIIDIIENKLFKSTNYI